MSTRKPLAPLAVAAVLLLALGLPAAAQDAPPEAPPEPGDPIIRLDSETKYEIDLAVVVRDMVPRLLAMMAEEDPEEAETLRRVLDVIGVDALQRLKLENKQTRDRSRAEFELTLDPAMSGTLIHRLLTIPNGECRFGRYVPRDELVMFMTLHNLPDYMDAMLDIATAPEMVEMMGDGAPLDAEGELEFNGFAPRRDLLPLLEGELDLFILQNDGQADSPFAAPVFLVLGASDGFALRDKIIELIGTMGGEQGGGLGQMLAGIEPETVGGFELTVLPMGGAYAVSEDFLVIGMNADRMRGLLAEPAGDLDVPDGIEWVHMDGPAYGSFMESMMGLATMADPDEAGETAWMMELYGLIFDHVEYEEMLYRSRENGLEGEIIIEGPVATGVYQMLPVMLDRLPEMLAEQRAGKEENAYRHAIAQLDAAFIAWAADHDGTYPADPALLLEEGYLDAWPVGEPTPPGVYVDWGYTYHPYLDEDGAVVGYIFFLYGGGEMSGHDVYSADNVATDGPFAFDPDGAPDGVVSFCYDGTALEIVNEHYGW